MNIWQCVSFSCIILPQTETCIHTFKCIMLSQTQTCAHTFSCIILSQPQTCTHTFQSPNPSPSDSDDDNIAITAEVSPWRLIFFFRHLTRAVPFWKCWKPAAHFWVPDTRKHCWLGRKQKDMQASRKCSIKCIRQYLLQNVSKPAHPVFTWEAWTCAELLPLTAQDRSILTRWTRGPLM